jgi:hypothetical protein
MWSRVFLLFDGLDFIILDGVVGVADPHDQGQAQRVVATPTTIAVRIRTWGRGLEYCLIPSARIGAVPPVTLAIRM